MYNKRHIFSRRQTTARRFRLPISLILVVIAIALCVLIPYNPINLTGADQSDQASPTPVPTYTPSPVPTKEHIGRLIFTCTRGDYNQLCMINADGTAYQQLTDVRSA